MSGRRLPPGTRTTSRIGRSTWPATYGRRQGGPASRVASAVRGGLPAPRARAGNGHPRCAQPREIRRAARRGRRQPELSRHSHRVAAKTIPNRSTRILIYCNNNFANAGARFRPSCRRPRSTCRPTSRSTPTATATSGSWVRGSIRSIRCWCSNRRLAVDRGASRAGCRSPPVPIGRRLVRAARCARASRRRTVRRGVARRRAGRRRRVPPAAKARRRRGNSQDA